MWPDWVYFVLLFVSFGLGIASFILEIMTPFKEHKQHKDDLLLDCSWCLRCLLHRRVCIQKSIRERIFE